ncbi:MAG: hypothetical protein R3B57_10315 [Phycisphaerales bacterium]
MRARLRTIGALAIAASLLALPGCGGSNKYRPTGDPLLDLRNPDLQERDRIEAAQFAWVEVDGGARDRAETRAAMRDLARSLSTPVPIREQLVRTLMEDPTPEGRAESRELAAVMLPREKERTVVAILSQAAGENGWEELTTSLVRSYARPLDDVEDDIRTERAALEALHPDQAVSSVVFDVFLEPGDPPAGWDVTRWREGSRADAWELLSRLDPGGEVRSALLLRVGGQETSLPPDAAALVTDLRRCLHELGCVPQTSMELQWLHALLHEGTSDERKLNDAWWRQASDAIARLEGEQRNGLELRHAEAIRWAAANRSGWLEAPRARLLAELDARLDGRTVYRRTKELRLKRTGRAYRLRDVADKLDWADLLTLLVVDDAVHDPGVIERAFLYAEADKDDDKTSYGGTLQAGDAGAESLGDDAAWRLILFRPRARDRVRDEVFVVGEDLVRYSDRALAHFRLNAWSHKLSDVAGPSDDDFEQAKRSGRTSIVFTRLAEDRINVDCYAPDGSSVDLGEIRR